MCIKIYAKKGIIEKVEEKCSFVTDANLTLNPDYQWIGGPGRSSGITTFSW